MESAWKMDTPWIVSAVEYETESLLLSGGSPEETIAAVRANGRNAILVIDIVPHFIAASTGNLHEIDYRDLTVFSRGTQLVVTRGFLGKVEKFVGSALDDYHHRAASLLGKKALFTKENLIDDPE